MSDDADGYTVGMSKDGGDHSRLLFFPWGDKTPLTISLWAAGLLMLAYWGQEPWMLDIYTALLGRVASSCGLTHPTFFRIPCHSWGVKDGPGHCHRWLTCSPVKKGSVPQNDCSRACSLCVSAPCLLNHGHTVPWLGTVYKRKLELVEEFPDRVVYSQSRSLVHFAHSCTNPYIFITGEDWDRGR